MSTNLDWPKYTAHGPAGPCGHQHGHLAAAMNCARNLSWHHRGANVGVRRRHADSGQSVVANVATHEAP
jgi:hypothetical protein